MQRDEARISPQSYKNQQQFVDRIKEQNQAYFEKKGRHRRFYIGTFGCQMNVRDSETLRGILKGMGYEESTVEKEADLIIYNTCCVRENAENKVYGNLGFLKPMKKAKPDLKIIVCGCMMQQDSVIENIQKSYRHVDVIFGTFNIQRLPELLYTNMETKEMVIDVWPEHGEIVEDLPAERESPFKASVNIMFGCNNYCTYCIVPYVRGRERSREVADILAEIRGLVDSGVKEILLLGQNVNSYGLTLAEPVSFADLLREVNKVPGLERIRFVTSHPKDISEDLIQAMKECDKVCAHLHLPFQSGSDRILKAMGRKYTKAHYLEMIHKAKEAIPNIGITTDIIVGFPGETEEDFEETLDVCRQVGFCTAYTFIYSKRTGTPAAKMECQIPEDVIKNRFSRLLETINPMVYDFNDGFLGQIIGVLAEEINPQNPELITGRNEQNMLVHFKGDPSSIGQVVPVHILDHKTFYLIGEQLGC